MSMPSRTEMRDCAVRRARELLRMMHRCCLESGREQRRLALDYARNLHGLFAFHGLTFEELQTTRGAINHKILFLIADSEEEIASCGFFDPAVGVAPISA